MLTTPQLAAFFPDLGDERVETALALVHSRFCTNTFPSWPLAHPYRFIAHNGEINTVQGNRNWMRAREAMLAQRPAARASSGRSRSARPARSDTATFDEVLELLHLGGRSPAARDADDDPGGVGEPRRRWTPAKRAFYRFHSSLMEPWDGPASIAFTDGTVIGAVLDRNGLRPSRYWVTDDDLVIMASEVGVLDIDPAQGRQEGPAAARAGCSSSTPRRAASSTTTRSRPTLAAEHPYAEWLERGPRRARRPARPRARRLQPPQRAAAPAGVRLHARGAEAHRRADGARRAPSRSARWAPTRRSPCCRDRPRLLFDYFQQLFAQVTNPPLDAIREELVTRSARRSGPREPARARPGSCRQLALPFPIIDNDELAKLIHINDDGDVPRLSPPS